MDSLKLLMFFFYMDASIKICQARTSIRLVNSQQKNACNYSMLMTSTRTIYCNTKTIIYPIMCFIGTMCAYYTDTNTSWYQTFPFRHEAVTQIKAGLTSASRVFSAVQALLLKRCVKHPSNATLVAELLVRLPWEHVVRNTRTGVKSNHTFHCVLLKILE